MTALESELRPPGRLRVAADAALTVIVLAGSLLLCGLAIDDGAALLGAGGALPLGLALTLAPAGAYPVTWALRRRRPADPVRSG